ncbi:MAG: hypothetical protein IJF15_07240 [Oscillospiraceae bacterium]|nr:hypothetical protein [Oscillospiraceae bacterium]
MNRKDMCALALGIGLAVSLICAAFAPQHTAAWWGVVYRPLCQSVTTENAAETMARGVETEEGFTLRFKTVELWESLHKRFK